MEESSYTGPFTRSRPSRFDLPELSADDREILRQEAIVRKEFGEEGVKKFWELLPAATKNDPT